jgi:hypothetical protein
VRIGFSAGVLAFLVAGSMCTSAWAQPAPDTSFAQTAQASAAQYTSPTGAVAPANAGGTTCTVVVENGQLVRVCRTTNANGNLVNTTRQVLGSAGASNGLTSAGGLAFTGLDLTVLMLLGASLITAGVVLRVGTRTTQRKRLLSA